MKPYRYKDYELDFFVGVCSDQFKHKTPEMLTRGVSNLLSLIERNQGSRLPLLTLNFGTYITTGFISEYFTRAPAYPYSYEILLDAIRKNIFQIRELVKQCDNDYVTAWYIYLCGELSVKVHGISIGGGVHKILAPGTFDNYLLDLIIKAMSLETESSRIKNSLPKRENKKYENYIIGYPAPKLSTKHLLSFISPNKRDEVIKSNYRYAFQTKTTRREVEAVVNRVFNKLRETYECIYNIEFHLSDNLDDSNNLWGFLVRLIIEARFKDNEINKETIEGLELFLLRKLRKSSNVNIGDFLELCKTLNW